MQWRLKIGSQTNSETSTLTLGVNRALPTPHISPIHSSVHWHLNMANWSRHVAPFWHGSLAHSFISKISYKILHWLFKKKHNTLYLVFKHRSTSYAVVLMLWVVFAFYSCITVPCIKFCIKSYLGRNSRPHSPGYRRNHTQVEDTWNTCIRTSRFDMDHCHPGMGLEFLRKNLAY